MSVMDGTLDFPLRWRAYCVEARYELLRSWRTPAFSLPTVAFPLMFYLLFAVLLDFGPPGARMPVYLLATYGTFGVIGAALFGLGVGVAVERGQGWLLLKRASPMPPGAQIAAKLATSAVFALLIIAALCAVAVTLGGVSLPVSQFALLAVTLTGLAMVFCSAGLAIGYWAPPQGAIPLVNLIYMPAGFLSGLLIPLELLPDYLRTAALALPPYHAGQLALACVGLGEGRSPLLHIAVLAVFTAVCLAIARAGYRRMRDT